MISIVIHSFSYFGLKLCVDTFISIEVWLFINLAKLESSPL